MAGILFSSWQGEVIDNRGKPEAKFAFPKRLTIPDEFSKGEPIRAFMGWDGFALLDANVDMVNMCTRYVEAVQKESCGRCVPCRVGTRIILDVMNRISEGQGKRDDLERVKGLARYIKEGSKCQIGQTGLVPLLDALTYFKDAFDKCIDQGQKAKAGTYRVSVTAPCMSVCPTKLKIPQYIEQIAECMPSGSLATIRQDTCMAGTLGRVCVRPCESNCRRGNIDESISIKYLKRFAADYELEKRKKPAISSPASTNSKKVAVLGAGPAGLSCSYFLVQMGYKVTIFERLPEPGGMAAVGIPDYRLPRDILGGEVDVVKDLGVEIRYNSMVGKDVTISDLQEEFDAIFIGVGAHNSSPMGVEGEDRGYKGFIPGVKYLLDVNMGKDPYPEGKKVVVVGGGNVAMDCVRSSFRIGKPDVNLVYRRTKAEMPADPVEIHDAEEEGVTFHYLCNPTRIIEKEGKVVAVECIRMELGEPDKSGRRRPVPIPGSEFIIETDILIPAIGQAVDMSFLEEKVGVQVTKWNTILVDQDTFETSRPGIFAAGDCETGPDVLVRACGNGKRAAWRIDQYLRGEERVPSEKERFHDLFNKVKVYQKDENLGIAGGEPRLHLRMLDPQVRKLTFDEVEEGYRMDEAIKEAMRCLRCYRIGMVAV
ncbi:MAG: Glutamate synthase (NADPH) small chain [Syntrophorhabdaceae bacterium PtaU1.Bin034]|nr:MAG: Glutamate synthase (NADPH) small chain [Syntrophorhabdaceae bacterium PtaU1.Bin034]